MDDQVPANLLFSPKTRQMIEDLTTLPQPQSPLIGVDNLNYLNDTFSEFNNYNKEYSLLNNKRTKDDSNFQQINQIRGMSQYSIPVINVQQEINTHLSNEQINSNAENEILLHKIETANIKHDLTPFRLQEKYKTLFNNLQDPQNIEKKTVIKHLGGNRVLRDSSYYSPIKRSNSSLISIKEDKNIEEEQSEPIIAFFPTKKSTSKFLNWLIIRRANLIESESITDPKAYIIDNKDINDKIISKETLCKLLKIDYNEYKQQLKQKSKTKEPPRKRRYYSISFIRNHSRKYMMSRQGKNESKLKKNLINTKNYCINQTRDKFKERLIKPTELIAKNISNKELTLEQFTLGCTPPFKFPYETNHLLYMFNDITDKSLPPKLEQIKISSIIRFAALKMYKEKQNQKCNNKKFNVTNIKDPLLAGVDFLTQLHFALTSLKFIEAYNKNQIMTVDLLNIYPYATKGSIEQLHKLYLHLRRNKPTISNDLCEIFIGPFKEIIKYIRL